MPPNNSGSFSIATLLVAVTSVSVILAVGQLYSLKHAICAMGVMMLVALISNEKLVQLATTPDGVTCWASFLMWFAISLPYATGPMGGRVYPVELMRNITLSWNQIGWMHMILPFVYGGIASTLSFCMLFGALPAKFSFRILAAVVMIVCITNVWIAALIQARLSTFVIPFVAIAGILLAVWFCKTPTAQLGVAHIIGSLALLAQCVKPHGSICVTDILQGSDIGFWVLVVGAIIALSANIVRLC